MGRERSRKMEYFFLYVTCSVITLSSMFGCSHYAHQRQAQAYLSRAAAYVAEGDFNRAIQKNDQAFKRYPDILGDRRLYQRGLIYVHPRNPGRDDAKAIQIFSELRKSYPGSRLSAEAEVWIITLEAAARRAGALVKKDKTIEKLKKRTNLLKEKNKKLSHTLDERMRTDNEQTVELRKQINQLESQLDKLKKIDLGIEKKKRQGAPE